MQLCLQEEFLQWGCAWGGRTQLRSHWEEGEGRRNLIIGDLMGLSRSQLFLLLKDGRND